MSVVNASAVCVCVCVCARDGCERKMTRKVTVCMSEYLPTDTVAARATTSSPPLVTLAPPVPTVKPPAVTVAPPLSTRNPPWEIVVAPLPATCHTANTHANIGVVHGYQKQGHDEACLCAGVSVCMFSTSFLSHLEQLGASS